jgi:hypothetical protein
MERNNTHTLVKLPDITSCFGKDIPGLLTSLTNLESSNKTLEFINKKIKCMASQGCTYKNFNFCRLKVSAGRFPSKLFPIRSLTIT